MIRILSSLRTFSGFDEYPIFKELVSSNVELLNFDDRVYGYYDIQNLMQRIARKSFMPWASKSFNNQLRIYSDLARPNKFIAFKSTLINVSSIRHMKKRNIESLIIYPDLNPLAHSKAYIYALKECDIFFHTKPNLADKFSKIIRKDAVCIGPFYNSALVSSIEPIDENIGVSFVGHHSPGKEQSLRLFCKSYSGNISVYGDRWSHLNGSFGLKNVRFHPAIYGESIHEIYRKSVCSLGFLMESISKKLDGDEITSRSILVPAYGGLLLHPKNSSSKSVFEKSSIVLFESVEEASDLARNFYSDSALRLKTAFQQQQSVLKYGTSSIDFVNKYILK